MNWEAFKSKYKVLKQRKELCDDEKEFIKFIRKLKNIILE